MNRYVLALALAALPAASFASTIAIIDSGTDYKHKELIDQYLLNKREIGGNKSDDDANGYKDDLYGWNFAENKSEVIDYSYLSRLKPVMPDVHKLFEIQVRTLDGTATQEDKDWIKAKKADEKFLKELQVFGNFAHGTHVAGITAGASTTKIMENHPFAVKLIPTEVKLPFSVMYAQSPAFQTVVKQAKLGIPTGLKEFLFSFGIRFLVGQQTKVFEKISLYVASRNADVANCSFGTGYGQAKTIVQMLYNFVFNEQERSDEKLNEFTREFMQIMLMKSRELVVNAPKTLFVMAAGNDGVDNTVAPSSPANLREDNSITVAATVRNRELASFSNYGLKVDVAAPGVGISSLYPGDDRGLMSGTSQAAPYVAYVAAEIKNRNPSLRPVEIKQILMNTVDTKDWLLGKVASMGIVNMERASDAATLSKEMPVGDAIQAARYRIRDQEVEAMPEPKTATPAEGLIEEDILAVPPLPSPVT